MREVEFTVDAYHEFKNSGKVYAEHKEEVKHVIKTIYTLLQRGETEG